MGNGSSNKTAENTAAGQTSHEPGQVFEAPGRIVRAAAGVFDLDTEGCIQTPSLSHLPVPHNENKTLPRSGKSATIGHMVLAIFAMHFLEAAFFLGLIGSSIVVIISFIEDGKELFGKD
jgi:hypothetical protein